jgi:hypothetical protein
VSEERFSIWLSMAARDRPIRSRLLPELGRAGFWRKTASLSPFSGVRIGRGAGVGRVLAVSGTGLAHGRRVATDTRVIRLDRGGPSGAVRDHLRYLVRARESEDRRPALYGPEIDEPDAAAFARSCRDDRHQFRTIIGAQDACEYEDLRPLVRRVMNQAARDLRTPLDWVAADHYDTAHPHSHIVIRGVDAGGDDLVIAREYIQHGFQQRAAALVALDLGPDLATEKGRKFGRAAEIGLERPTEIDRDLLASMDGQGRVSPDDNNRWRQAERAGRLRVLETLGLAHADGHGLWYLQPDLIERLGEIDWHNRVARVPTRSTPGLGDDGQSALPDQNLQSEDHVQPADERAAAPLLECPDDYFAALGAHFGRGSDRALTDRGSHVSRQIGWSRDAAISSSPQQRSLTEETGFERALSPARLLRGCE